MKIRNSLSPFGKCSGGEVRCTLCPHRCILIPGSRGVCRVREGADGGIALPYQGLISAEAVDPVEKKPLYHFKPGSSTYSVGFYGCNLHCPFCQNHGISIDYPAGMVNNRVSPRELVDRAIDSGCPSISFTYSEPAIHAEYLLDTASLARDKGLATILVTNGYLNEEPARQILAVMDAVNVDLKCFREENYRAVLGGSLAPVKRFIKVAVGMEMHLEVTTLVVPGLNDTIQELGDIISWIAGIDRDIPWHVSAYHPAFRYTRRATPEELVLDAARLGAKSLSYVYPGNIPVSWPTRCPRCGKEVIQRRGFMIESVLTGRGACPECGHQIVKN